MINVFIIKKYAALLFAAMFTCICFYVGVVFYGLLWGVALLFVGLLVSLPVGNFLLKNPFSMMLEGKGLLAINFDSTGILRPFIVGLENPYIKGKLGKNKIEDIFDRETIAQLAAPKKAASKAVLEKDSITIKLDEKEYNNGRFALFHWPVIIWNDQIKSIVTKDFFSGKEKDAFAEHGVLYLNRKVEELTSVVRDFGRYVVELTKPQNTSIFANKWFWIIFVVFMGIILILFAPAILQAVQGFMGTTSQAANTIGSGAGSAITPR